MTALRFRAAVVDDAEAVVSLVESAYRGEASRAGWTTEADLLDGQRTDPASVKALILAPDSVVLLAIAPGDEAPVACCHVARERPGVAYFGMFAVRPAMQAQGLGRSLLAEAERMARDAWGCTCMTMTVIDIRAELIAWYERRGYLRTGERKAFPYGDSRFGLPKRGDLRFELLLKDLGR